MFLSEEKELIKTVLEELQKHFDKIDFGKIDKEKTSLLAPGIFAFIYPDKEGGIIFSRQIGDFRENDENQGCPAGCSNGMLGFPLNMQNFNKNETWTEAMRIAKQKVRIKKVGVIWYKKPKEFSKTFQDYN